MRLSASSLFFRKLGFDLVFSLGCSSSMIMENTEIAAKKETPQEIVPCPPQSISVIRTLSWY